MRGGKGERGGDAVALQLVEEKIGHAARIHGVGKARFVREGVLLQPGQQAVGRRSDHVKLRVVHMQVNEAGRDQLAAQVLQRQVGELADQGAVVTECQHPLNALGVGAGDQQTVALMARLVLLVKPQQGGAVGIFHGVTVANGAHRRIRPRAWAAYAGCAQPLRA